jgi:hypothetical protein
MTANELLQQPTPPAAEMPARIEALNLCAFDLSAEIAGLKDEAARHEEQAATDAAGEPNDAKRKARRCELLRANDDYWQTRQAVTDLERVHFQLQERAARLRREFRLYVADALKESTL